MEKGKGRMTPRFLVIATGEKENEMENSRRELDLRWDGRKNREETVFSEGRASCCLLGTPSPHGPPRLMLADMLLDPWLGTRPQRGDGSGWLKSWGSSCPGPHRECSLGPRLRLESPGFALASGVSSSIFSGRGSSVFILCQFVPTGF